MRTPHPRRRTEPLAIQLLAFRDDSGAPLPLPPLFVASTPEREQLHERIYHVVALALRAYMNTWYAKISPRDRLLLPTVNRDVIVPLVGPLLATLTADEGRERIVDLVLLHAPILAATHVHAYWSARASVFDASVAQAYHARVPTLAAAQVDGKYVLNPAYAGALVDALLALRLPEADYAAEAERIVIREVVARAVLGSVAKRLAAPWFYAQIALKFMGQPGDPIRGRKPKMEGDRTRKVLETLRDTYAAAVKGIMLLWTAAVWLVAFLSAAPPPKAKYARVADGPLALLGALLGMDGRGGLVSASMPSRLAFAAAKVVITLLAPVLDRLLPFLVEEALTAKTGLRVVDLVERLLFPDGWPGPPPIEPTDEEARELDANFRQRVHERLPATVQKAIAPLPGSRPADALVDPISDAGCNVHLVGILLSAIVAALVPELVAERPLDKDTETPAKDGLKIDTHGLDPWHHLYFTPCPFMHYFMSTPRPRM